MPFVGGGSFRLLIRQQLHNYFSLLVRVSLRETLIEQGQVLLVKEVLHQRTSLIRTQSAEAPAIHLLKAIDLMGSSELPTVLMKCVAFRHPLHPANSNAQNSSFECASAAIIADQHRIMMGRCWRGLISSM